MSKRFAEHSQFDLLRWTKRYLKNGWKQCFRQKYWQNVKGVPSFVFFEDLPRPMVCRHSPMKARSIKDNFLPLQNDEKVSGKAEGWMGYAMDLPVELEWRKRWALPKKIVGKKITVCEYNAACRKRCDENSPKSGRTLRTRWGYWVIWTSLHYVCNRYIETLWWLLKQLYKKGLFKRYTFSPISGCRNRVELARAESTWFLPWCERYDVVAQFMMKNPKPEMSAWVTPYFLRGLPQTVDFAFNTALCGAQNWLCSRSDPYNAYTGGAYYGCVGQGIAETHFNPKAAEIALEDSTGDKLSNR